MICGGVPGPIVKGNEGAAEATLPPVRRSRSKRVACSGAKNLNAQREQRDCAHTHDQDRQCHRVVVEPMFALYTHDAPRPAKPPPADATRDGVLAL
jgi:hypothetical protein